MQIRQMIDEAVFSLQSEGIYRMPNHDDAVAVVEGVTRRLQRGDLTIQEPAHGFGGEYTFRSETRLGSKPIG